MGAGGNLALSTIWGPLQKQLCRLKLRGRIWGGRETLFPLPRREILQAAGGKVLQTPTSAVDR